jgi:hypothetical protein
MTTIFDPPVVSDRLAKRLGAEGDLTGVKGNLLGVVPQPGLGVLVPGQAGNAGGADDQAVPLGVELALNVEDLDQTVLLTAMGPGVDALEALDRCLVGGDVLKGRQQGRLVGLDLGEQRVAAVPGGLKRFFGSVERRR